MGNWWDGKALDQITHERINAEHYPGTRELCRECDEPTGKAGAGEDSLFTEDCGPYCEDCYSALKPTDDEYEKVMTLHDRIMALPLVASYAGRDIEAVELRNYASLIGRDGDKRIAELEQCLKQARAILAELDAGEGG